MKKKEKSKDFIFTNVNPSVTIGRLKYKKDRKKFTGKYTLIGRVNVDLLKEFLSHLKDGNIVGIYIDKNKELTPLHCKGWLVCPRILEFEDNDEKYEF